MTPRAITGIGVASALGVSGADGLFDAIKAALPLGSRPAAPIQSFDASKYDALPIVEVPAFDPTTVLGDKGLRTLDRLTKLLLVAARVCLHDAGLKKDNQWVALAPERVGVCCSNAYGSLESISELDRVAKLEDARYINPAKFPNTVSNSAAGYVSIWEDLRALNVSVSDGNCGGLDALACTDIFLATSRADAILTGGGEAMSEALFLAFQKLGSLGDCRIGEGAVFFAIEPLEHARARGATVRAEIVGYGTAFRGPDDETSLVHVSREALARAIESALADAALSALDVDLVVSGVSGLRFDEEELAAIEQTVPGKPVAAPKLALGETLGAGGALGVAAAIAAATPRCAAAGPLVRGVAPARVKHALVTAVGYYGNASAVVVRAPD